MRSDVVRAEDAYLTEPEPADERCAECGCDPDDHNADGTCGRCGDCDGYHVAEPCGLCGGSPCICDRTTEALIDEMVRGDR